MAKLSYKKSGVDYNIVDPIKKLAQSEGLKTKTNIKNSEFKEIVKSRGETAYILETNDSYFAFVEEGLGSKNLIADHMRAITGKTYYDWIAYDTVVSIVMDLITVGAKPLTVLSYWAVGDSKWFDDKKRARDFVNGWKKACDVFGVTWGGGETPVLKNIVYDQTIDLAGAAFGVIKPKERIILGGKLQNGDLIIMLESSGIMVNGLTLARKLAEKLPKGYRTKLPNNKMYGEELLTPTKTYYQVIQDIFDSGVDIHYMANITGHGWRKLMRARKNFTYIIEKLPRKLDIFNFIQTKAKLSDKEMYATFNMGAGFAIYVNTKDAEKVLKISDKHNIKAWICGRVEKGPKRVIIKPLKIIYEENELNIR